MDDGKEEKSKAKRPRVVDDDADVVEMKRVLNKKELEKLLPRTFLGYTPYVSNYYNERDERMKETWLKAIDLANNGYCSECSRKANPDKRCDYCRWIFCDNCNEFALYSDQYWLCWHCHEYEPYHGNCIPSRTLPLPPPIVITTKPTTASETKRHLKTE